MKDRALYSIKETRELLGGISRNSIYRILGSGNLKSVVIGCRRFISSGALAEFIERSTTDLSPAVDPARERKSSQKDLPLPLPTAIRVPRKRSKG